MTFNGKRQAVLVLGGAGFVGSNIARKFVDEEWAVTVLDGCLPKTGGRIENIQAIRDKITFHPSRIEEIANLSSLVGENDLIIDSMACTSHSLARKEPLYDLKLNAESHLYLIRELNRYPDKKVIYLGSRVQYGSPKSATITEETCMIPEDVQGVHKLCAESYFRLYSKLHGFAVASLRIPNCYGMNQPREGEDVGLLGNFIRDILGGKDIDVYDGARKRDMLFAKDLSDIVYRVAQKDFHGFVPLNVSGTVVSINQLVSALIKINGGGSITKKSLPKEIKAAEMGSSVMTPAKLIKLIGKVRPTDLTASLKETMDYFRNAQGVTA